jgi:hypothetical protein
MRRADLQKLTYDDEIFQCVQTREDGLQKVPLRLEPTEGEAARFIMDRCLTPAIRRTIVRGAFKARLYGWSAMEIVWDLEAWRGEGVLVPRDVSERCPEFFAVRPDGTLVQNVTRDGPGQRVTRIPALQRRIADVPGAGHQWVVMDTRYKFLLTRSSPTWDNPYGEALLSRLYWPWFFRNASWQFLIQYLERYAVPILVGTIQPDSEMSADRLAEVLMRAHQDAVIGLKGGSVQAVSLNNAGHELYRNVEEMLVRRIEKAVLGQTLTSGTDGGSGNRALGQVHDEVRKDKTDSDIGLILPTVRTFVAACHELNGFVGPPPEVVFGDEVNLAEPRARRDAELVRAGIVGGFSEDYLMDNYGFRPGEIVMPAAPGQAGPGQAGGPAPGGEEDGEDGEENEGKASLRLAARDGPGGHLAAPGFGSTDFLLEALSLWGAMRAGSPIFTKEILSTVKEAVSPAGLAESVRRLQEIERLRPQFAAGLFGTDDAALAIGDRSGTGKGRGNHT